MNDFNQQVITEFRTNDGKVGGPFVGDSLLLLTTTGAKSGQPRIMPLVYMADGDRLVIFASKAGAPTNPDWFHNLVANPVVNIEVGAESFQARAIVAESQERERLYTEMAERSPNFAEYQQKTTRQIPVVLLERIG